MKKLLRASGLVSSLFGLMLLGGCGSSEPRDEESSQGSAQALDDADSGDANSGDAKDPPKDPARVVASPEELKRMENYLSTRIDRSAIKLTLHERGGRNVDCIDINRQPGLANREVKLELAPRSLPPELKVAFDDTAKAAEVEPLYEFAQTGAEQLAACPKGTVPIREVLLEDLARFATLEEFFTKTPVQIEDARSSKLEAPTHAGPTSLHQYAHAYKFVKNWGAWATINVWRPYTELNNEFSLGQIWVTAGSGSGLQTLEVGVQKYVNLYNDSSSHLFIYSTRDNYNTTGCYNNTCGDFVQVSSSIYPGAAISPTSVYNGTQYEIGVYWLKDTDTGSWWLNVLGKWVGYYPRSLFSSTGLRSNAAEIDFGGEIIDHRNLNLHTSTDMGSGQFPSAWWQRAAYMRLLRYFSSTSGSTVYYSDVPSLTTSRSDSNCYDIATYAGDPNWHSYFFYGGPGFSSVNCR